jgi:hypothetical protein
MQISEEVKQRIEKERDAKVDDFRKWEGVDDVIAPAFSIGYEKGAEAEYLRAQDEIRALREQLNGTDVETPDEKTQRELSEWYRKQLREAQEEIAELKKMVDYFRFVIRKALSPEITPPEIGDLLAGALPAGQFDNEYAELQKRPQWLKVGGPFPDNPETKVFKAKRTNKIFFGVEDFFDEYLLFQGDRYYYVDLLYLAE